MKSAYFVIYSDTSRDSEDLQIKSSPSEDVRINFYVHVFRNVFLSVLFVLCFTTLAVAEDDTVGIDVAFQLSNIRTQKSLAEEVIGIGGRIGYNISSIVFLDAGVIHEPEGFSEGFGSKNTIALGGFRFGAILDNTIGVFAKARAGAIWLYPKSYEWIPETGIDREVGRKEVYPAFDVGIIVEHYFKRNFFVRIDVGDYIIPFGINEPPNMYEGRNHYRAGTTHNFALEFGFGFRF